MVRGEISTVPEILHRAIESQNLHPVANAALIHLHLTLEQAPEHLRSLLLCINDLILLEILNRKIFCHDTFLVRCEGIPHLGHILTYNLLKGTFLDHD